MARPRSHVIWGITESELTRLVASAKSTADVLRHFGLDNVGPNNRVLRKRIAQLGLSTEHLARKHSAMVRHNKVNQRKLQSLLTRHCTVARHAIKRRLIEAQLLKPICAVCGLKSVWQDKPLVLVLDHINGINDDYRLSNLRLVCPNCNSQLATFSGRNQKPNNAL